MIRTMKEELFWLREWRSASELTTALSEWMDWYNNHYLHSALGYRPSNQVKKAYNSGHKTILKTA